MGIETSATLEVVDGGERLWVNPAEYLSAIIETQSDVTSLELDPATVMGLVTERSGQMSGVVGVAVLLIENDSLVCRAAVGIATPFIGTRLPLASAGQAITRGQIVYRRRGAEQKHSLHDLAGAETSLVVPVHQDGNIVGVLKVLGGPGDALDEGHVPRLRLMAGLLGLALGHACEMDSKRQLLDERRQALHQAREFRERFRSAFEHAAIGMAIVNLDGRFLQVNRSLCELVGYAEAELLATDFQSITHPDDLQADLSHVRQLVAGEVRGYQMTKRYFHKDGRTVWVLLSVSLVRDEQDSPQYFISQIQDVTEQRRAAGLERDRREVLEMVARDRPLADVLLRLVKLVENQVENAAASFMLVQDGAICQYAPNVPRGFAAAVDQRPLFIAAKLSSLPQEIEGIAVSNIEKNELWETCRPAALAAGLEAAWSAPIVLKDGTHTGLLVAYRRHPALPSAGEALALTAAGQLAAVIIEHHQTTRQLDHLVHHDPLTGLPNRVLFEDRLQQAMRLAEREGTLVGLFALDIDHFKLVNDTLGHEAGDALLQQFSARLRSQLRSGDTLARMGGDEFMVVLPSLTDPSNAATVAEKLVACLAAPFAIDGQQLAVTGSIGISIYPRDGDNAARLQKFADKAMYRVKRSGRNGFAMA